MPASAISDRAGRVSMLAIHTAEPSEVGSIRAYILIRFLRVIVPAP